MEFAGQRQHLGFWSYQSQNTQSDFIATQLYNSWENHRFSHWLSRLDDFTTQINRKTIFFHIVSTPNLRLQKKAAKSLRPKLFV